MASVKCPKCALLNDQLLPNCRRCQAPLANLPVHIPGPNLGTGNQPEKPKQQLPSIAIVCIAIGAFIVIGAIGNALKGSSGSSSSSLSRDSAPSKPSLELLDKKDSVTEYGSSTIVGTVKNNSTKEYRFVMIEFNIYDSKDNQIGTAHDTISNLEPGGKWAFKALVLEKDFAKYKLKELKGY